MNKLLFCMLVAAIAVSSCSSSKKTSATQTTKASTANYELLDRETFKLTGVSDDDTYGYSEKNAIKVGGGIESGAANERKYLNGLLGPNGETITYVRRGSCCPVKSENGIMGTAILDIYEIKYNDEMKPIVLYINMYDPGELKAPKGFTYRK